MKYALLIDSENAEPRMDEIFQELTKYGDTPIRYLLGNFTQSSPTHPWIKICQKHAITCVQTMNFTKGKNSLDISLVIEGMKVLYEKAFIDGVIIIASDSDYTPLAREWRNAGKEVIGIGRKLTPESYRASCTKFIYVENIFNKAEAQEEEEDSNRDVSIEKLDEIIKSVLNENDGMAQLSVIVESIRKAYTDFDVRNYGFQKARDFFQANFKDLKVTEEKKNSFFISFRDKEEASPAPSKPLKEKPKKAEKPHKEKQDHKKKKEVVTEVIQSTWVPDEDKETDDEPKAVPVTLEKAEETVPVKEEMKEPASEPVITPVEESVPEEKTTEPEKQEEAIKEEKTTEPSKPRYTHEELLAKTMEIYSSQKKTVTFSKMNFLCKKNHIYFRELGYARFKDLLTDCGFTVEGSIIKSNAQKAMETKPEAVSLEETAEVSLSPEVKEEPVSEETPVTPEAEVSVPEPVKPEEPERTEEELPLDEE